MLFFSKNLRRKSKTSLYNGISTDDKQTKILLASKIRSERLNKKKTLKSLKSKAPREPNSLKYLFLPSFFLDV